MSEIQTIAGLLTRGNSPPPTPNTTRAGAPPTTPSAPLSPIVFLLIVMLAVVAGQLWFQVVDGIIKHITRRTSPAEPTVAHYLAWAIAASILLLLLEYIYEIPLRTIV